MDPLLKELHYKSGVAVVRHAPPELAGTLQAWQDNGVDVDPMLMPGAGFVLVFVTTPDQIDKQAKDVVGSLAPDDPILWFAYPEKDSARYTSDMDGENPWKALEDLGLKSVRKVAIDEKWSAQWFRHPGAGPYEVRPLP